eukprot:CAMPEP_0181106668 /NCGR_PEP_ID=MMETSP1071-20121207/16651_1 /TAXON_ID=35127 /ORGANISM="Thalassiosira sp., Strain NH16" /LENGTH=94 /DNA_ID=CAMNT_0023190083 /DNA_START=326 /DNA_END=610 /DNA_ORIENTATION=-
MPHAEYDGSNNDGIMGLYSGETNEYGRPHGRGQMRYDNGTVFEGKWINGVRDGHGIGTSPPPPSAHRDRLSSLFTSWNKGSSSQSSHHGSVYHS